MYIHLIYALCTVDSIDLVFEILGTASIQHPRTCLAETRHLSQGYPGKGKTGGHELFIHSSLPGTERWEKPFDGRCLYSGGLRIL